jgi:hypothetical protein
MNTLYILAIKLNEIQVKVYNRLHVYNCLYIPYDTLPRVRDVTYNWDIVILLI